MWKVVLLITTIVMIVKFIKDTKGVPGYVRKGYEEQPRARTPLTLNEQPMYFRLLEAFPNHVILAQVPFSSVLTARSYSTRNTFDRKVADFAVCTRAFEIVTFIELDDSSHNGREAKDAARDKLLTDCGYTVLRYKMVPDVDKVRAAVAEIAIKALANKGSKAA